MLGWIAHASCHHFFAKRERELGAGFLLSPARRCRSGHIRSLRPSCLPRSPSGRCRWSTLRPARSRPAVIRFASLSLATGTTIAALLLPPLLGDYQMLFAKGGRNKPTLDTLQGVWFAWYGTSSCSAVMVAVLLAAIESLRHAADPEISADRSLGSPRLDDDRGGQYRRAAAVQPVPYGCRALSAPDCAAADSRHRCWVPLTLGQRRASTLAGRAGVLDRSSRIRALRFACAGLAIAAAAPPSQFVHVEHRRAIRLSTVAQHRRQSTGRCSGVCLLETNRRRARA